ncbi:phosphomannomutase [Vibrio mexicanus]|uniref:phosphomannomutase n=1 Tax=Vibrio mexicanus TaxID=1004326 RepID=UPI00063CE1BB|nr:phosphomannomutase [Vibrio mexicanus]
MSEKQNLISSEVISSSQVSFGTSGARGLVTQFTADVCAAFTAAFISTVKLNYSFDKVAIAIDNRPSSYEMAQACASVLGQLDIDVVFFGVIPTPALAYVAQEESIPAIMVTGSHIPFDRNGLKFYRPDGEISKFDEQSILNSHVEYLKISSFPELSVNPLASDRYINRYTSLFNNDWLSGSRIGIYEHSSSGRDLYFKIFEAFGADVIRLERSDSFVPIDTEAVSQEDRAKALKWSEEHNLDLLFSTDGDGDRPLVSDEYGNWLQGDVLGLLTSAALGIEALSIPVSCNSIVELSNVFQCVKRTKIGSPFVIDEFETLSKHYKSVAGFEANGGYLLGSDVRVNDRPLNALPTRDAILPVIMLLELSKKNSISKLVEELPSRYTYSDRLQNFANQKSNTLLENGRKNPNKLLETIGFSNLTVSHLNNVDGLRMTLSDDSILHLRASGNAPELRCYVEANKIGTAKCMVETTLKKILEI